MKSSVFEPVLIDDRLQAFDVETVVRESERERERERVDPLSLVISSIYLLWFGATVDPQGQLLTAM